MFVHLRYCFGAAKFVFSDEVNEALLSQQQVDVFTWNHCGEDAYNDLNLSLSFLTFRSRNHRIHVLYHK